MYFLMADFIYFAEASSFFGGALNEYLEVFCT